MGGGEGEGRPPKVRNEKEAKGHRCNDQKTVREGKEGPRQGAGEAQEGEEGDSCDGKRRVQEGEGQPEEEHLQGEEGGGSGQEEGGGRAEECEDRGRGCNGREERGEQAERHGPQGIARASWQHPEALNVFLT